MRSSRNQILVALSLAWVVWAVGCDRGPSGTSVVNANSPSSAPTAPTPEERDAARRALGPAGASPTPTASDTPSVPPGHPPLPAGGSPATGPARAGPKGLKFDAPPAWERRAPTGMSRVAHYVLPTTAPGQAVTELVVTVFPNTGAMAQPEPNIERWRGQFRTPDGTTLPAEAVQRSDSRIHDMPATTVRMNGRYSVAPMMGGDGKPSDVDYRMVATMITAGDQVYFFKVTGPEAAVRAADEDYEKLLQTVRPE